MTSAHSADTLTPDAPHAQRFGALRSLLHEAPSAARRQAVRSLLFTWPVARRNAEIIPYVQDFAARWGGFGTIDDHALDRLDAEGPGELMHLGLAGSLVLRVDDHTSRRLTRLFTLFPALLGENILRVVRAKISSLLHVRMLREQLGTIRLDLLEITGSGTENRDLIKLVEQFDPKILVCADNNQLTCAGVVPLLEAAPERRLRVLDCSETNVDQSGGQLLTRVTAAPTLRALKLHRTLCYSEFCDHVADSEVLSALRMLDLGDNLVKLEGFQSIGRARTINQVEHLDLSYNRPDHPQSAIAALAVPNALPALRELNIRNNILDVDALMGMEGADWLPRLEVLDLTDGILGTGALERIGKLSLHNLRHLKLDACNLSSDQLVRLASTETMTRLHTLSFQSNSGGFDPATLRAIADGPWRDSLRVLDLRGSVRGELDSVATHPSLTVQTGEAPEYVRRAYQDHWPQPQPDLWRWLDDEERP